MKEETGAATKRLHPKEEFVKRVLSHDLHYPTSEDSGRVEESSDEDHDTLDNARPLYVVARVSCVCASSHTKDRDGVTEHLSKATDYKDKKPVSINVLSVHVSDSVGNTRIEH